jgi:YidC/Oxa1 family membrane protein insertase
MLDQDGQRNLLLAIVLSVAVLLAWQLFYAGPHLKEEQERRQRSAQEQVHSKAQGGPQKEVPGTAPTSGLAAPSGAASAAPVLSREDAIRESARLDIDTPSLRGSIALKGGRIDDLVLAKYRETVDPGSPNVVLLSPSGAPNPYYAEYGWVAAAGALPLPDRDSVWKAEGAGPLTPEAPVTLVWDNGQGLVFRRRIAVDDNYVFTVTDAVENKSNREITLSPFALISRHGMPKVQGYYILHEGLIGVLGDAGLKEISYADALKEGGAKTFKETAGWVGITDKYWATAIVPDQKAPYAAGLSGTKRDGRDYFQADLLLNPMTIAPGAVGSVTSNLFAGAKQMSLIEAYASKLGAKQFDLLIDWGWFWFITKPMFRLLHWLSLLLGNYGLAVLATTVMVKALFFPLANKSYESMAKMKKLQPEMERIRERFKEDRVKQQQELMALYKNQKINPVSGCLPTVVQIPVFFALYKVLFITIDMRHAPFFGWIRDLSAPDPTSVFNLFGLLPFHPPTYLMVGAWPLIMGCTMFMQMQLNPQQPDPVQQKIFSWMPVIFTFMLASFPSGLVIYWAWNNVFSLLQQYAIMRRNNAEVHLWKNLGVDKWEARLKWLKATDFGAWKQQITASAQALPQALGKMLSRQSDAKPSTAKPSTAKAPTAKAPTAKAPTAKAPTDGGGDPPMARDEALRTLGLRPAASEEEIDAALDRELRRRHKGMNGSDQARRAKLDAARATLRGKEAP